MARSPKEVRTTHIVTRLDSRLAQYCPDLENWPRSWSGDSSDIAPGQRLLECFKPFLLDLLDAGLSRKTLRTHRDNLWILGGEMIRAFHNDPSLRKRPLEHWLDHAIGDDGGPLIYEPVPEDVQRSFDATCRRLSRFRQDAATTPRKA